MLRLIADDNVISLTYQFETLSGSKSLCLQDAAKIRYSIKKYYKFRNRGMIRFSKSLVPDPEKILGFGRLIPDKRALLGTGFKPKNFRYHFFNSSTKIKYSQEIDKR